LGRIAIISDVHGNLPALNAVLEDIKNKKVDKVYCLGDLVGYYCYFNEVIQKLIDFKIPSIMGNHDYAIVHNSGKIDRSKTCSKILQWQLNQASSHTLDFLRSLPTEMVLKLGDKSIFLVHGGLIDPVDEYLYDVNDEYFTQNAFEHDVLFTGHTHLPSFKKFYSGKTWVNPGSVGQSRDFDNRACYVIVNDSLDFEFVRVGYDYKMVIEQMAILGFDEYISEVLVNGKKIGY
jgi:putative phosphoesterase